ncbi:DMT family transporter, partial [Escherichia coli]|nr:DMT family transporter [Escherichia coli]
VVMCFYQPFWEFTGIFDLDTAISFSAIIIFGTAIAFCAYLESTKYLSPTKISVFASLEPFSSIILSIIFLNINFGFIELIGAFIIIFAVTILNI